MRTSGEARGRAVTLLLALAVAVGVLAMHVLPAVVGESGTVPSSTAVHPGLHGDRTPGVAPLSVTALHDLAPMAHTEGGPTGCGHCGHDGAGQPGTMAVCVLLLVLLVTVCRAGRAHLRLLARIRSRPTWTRVPARQVDRTRSFIELSVSRT